MITKYELKCEYQQAHQFYHYEGKGDTMASLYAFRDTCITLFRIAQCGCMGHALQETADPESGGGELYCTRCGYSHTYYW
jgi:hypothetical protein